MSMLLFELQILSRLQRRWQFLKRYSYMRDRDSGRKYKPTHREDAEWLTIDICIEFRKRQLKGQNNIKTLTQELVQRCDISELMAMNILNGFHAMDYVSWKTRYYFLV